MTEVGATREISFAVNGEPQTVHAYPMERLLDVIRQHLNLTGTKEGCGEGECGACSVLIDGALALSCLIPVAQAAGTKITTIEGISADPRWIALQESFLERGAAQCGICTPGMILASVQMLEKKPQPTMEEIREGLSGNLCRCTGYLQIFEAVAKAARHGAPA
jgi:aerobic carbon-monoxide dehydrogenase small subunit